MNDLLNDLRHCDLDTFVKFLTEYVQGSRASSVALRVPPNINVAVWVAERISADDLLRSRVQDHLPRLMKTLSSRTDAESIDRVTALFGFTRSADALTTAIALCDELDRAGRVEQALSFVRAIAGQLPSEPMLDLLARKGTRFPYMPFCLRALLKFDRRRAAALLGEPSLRDLISLPLLQSVFMDLSPDERIEALKEIYCTRPSPDKSMLDEIERICQVAVRVREGNSFMITVPHASQSFPNLPRETWAAWDNAMDRTSLKLVHDSLAEGIAEAS